MLNPATPIAALLNAPIRPGTITWIGLRPARRAPVQPVHTADLDPQDGLIGDHATGPTRQLTLIQAEHLPAIAAYLGAPRIEPAQLRRNIVIAGLNLLALKDKVFHLGTATLLATGPCLPCSRMEEILGPGGYNALRGHGGITARILTPGRIALGARIAPT